MRYKIKEVAEMAKVSVRTLHYYDQIGLLKPEFVNPAGYRLYSEDDLAKLQQILFFKELEFELNAIKDIIDNPNFDRLKALKVHRELLIEKKKRLDTVITTVNKTIESLEGGLKMDNKELFYGLNMKELEEHQKKYAEEAKNKWGNTDAYKESAERTVKYTKEDWAKIILVQNEQNDKLAALMDRDPKDPEVQELIGERRQFITEYFYDCPIEMFKGLGEMYVDDPRFKETFDKIKPGFAVFLRDAIRAYGNK